MKNGFTLIELSIVLVVIAMVIGGILVGQNLIESSRLSSFIKDIQKMDSAVKAFQAQYGQLPGDSDNAYTYFGADCAASSVLCNGDGDSIMEEAETYRAWKHLDASKYTSYGTDAVTGTSVTCAIGTNMPRMAIDAASAAFTYDNNTAYDSREARTATQATPGQMLQFGKVLSSQAAVANCADAGFITSIVAYQIDKKIDDGLAYDGKVLNAQDLSGCTTSSGFADDTNYDQANSGTNLCMLFYRLKI